jgi:hypothetical protein
MSKQKSEYEAPVVQRVFTDLEIFRLAGALRNGEGSPDDARELLKQFVHGCNTEAGPSPELLVYLRDAFSDFLYGGKSLDAALHFKKTRGRPKVSQRRKIALAIAVLKHRLATGSSLEVAVEHVEEWSGRKRTVIAAAWAECREGARMRIRGRRTKRFRTDPWTPEETAILRKIFGEGPL